MHEYQKEDIQECFQKRRLVFIGDSTTRQMFWAVAKKMDIGETEEDVTERLDQNQKHKDLEFISDGVKVQFIWDPWLNSTGLERELRMFRADPSREAESTLGESAGLILLGAPGLWHARHGQENFFKDFKESVDAVIPYMDHGPEEYTISPASRPPASQPQSPNLLLLAPVQVPRYQSLSPSREETITPAKIDQMNDYLQQVSAYSEADVVWSYSLMTWSGGDEYEESGLHVVENVAHRKADVLLNLRCNAASASKGYPFDRTCCSNYTQPAGIQWIFILVGMLALPMLSLLRRKLVTQIGHFLPHAEILRALTVIGLVACYCFYADRTQIFEKEQKQSRWREFIMACSGVGVAGILSIRRSKLLVTGQKTAMIPHEAGFLSRDQTDEWKGWMQFFILIYHYTHGSKTLWIYELVRLLVASYLFMTGLGHTLFFLKRGDYSLHRVGSVLVRLNLLSCILPYMMRTDYLFYYFAPLASFWFLVTYFTLKAGHARNSDLSFLFMKIVVSATITTAFTMTPGILEFIAFILKHSCAISWNLAEWRFRTFLDMYIVYAGIIVAILFHRASCLNSLPLAQRGSIDKLLQLIISNHRLSKPAVVLLSVGVLRSFWFVSRRYSTKEDFNQWQPYISFIPILCFIVLRNSHHFLRNYHSAVFAWLGRCSLETYILQYHIWLAGDTRGLLRLGTWNRWVETATISAVFLWISWRTGDATQKLTIWIVGKKPLPGYDDETLGSKDLSYLLQCVQDGESTPSKEMRFNIGGITWIETFLRKFRDDLRWRLSLIVLLLWMGNVTYS
jgi:hypothetical protein